MRGELEPRNTRNTRKGCGHGGWNHEIHETHEKGVAMGDVLYPDEVYAIQGAIFDVYKNIGAGFLEAVYQECLERELAIRGIPFESQKDISISYKGEKLNQTYRADLICYGTIIVELKAVKALLPEHLAQLHNYLRATKMRLGLLVNFSHYPGVEIKRIAN